MLVLAANDVVFVESNVWLPIATYTYNLIPTVSIATIGQVWSLCVEEHFYLLWPATFVWLRGRATLALGGTIIVAMVLRFALWEWFHGTLDIDTFTFTRMDTIAVGCLLAFAMHDDGVLRVMSRVRGQGDRVAAAAITTLALSIFVLSGVGKYA